MGDGVFRVFGEECVAESSAFNMEGGQPGTEKLALLDFPRQRRIMKLLATWAPIGTTTMRFDANWHVDDVDLPHHAGSAVGVFESAAAQRTRLQVILPSLVDRLGWKVRPRVFWMPFPTTRFSFPLTFLVGRFLGINDIAGRGLGGVGRILLCLGVRIHGPARHLSGAVDKCCGNSVAWAEGSRAAVGFSKDVIELGEPLRVRNRARLGKLKTADKR